MFHQSGYSRALSVDIGEIERRLRGLEQRLERLGSRTSARTVDAADRIATSLTSLAEQFRGGAGVATDEAARIGGEAVKIGNDALRRLSREVERRPLMILAVAVGVGILVGLASHRR